MKVVKVTYDPKVEALYVYVSNTKAKVGKKVTSTKTVRAMVNVDYVGDCPSGIEILLPKGTLE